MVSVYFSLSLVFVIIIIQYIFNVLNSMSMEDDSPNGRITLSSKGFTRDFEKDVFLTSLTQSLQSPKRDVVSMTLNVFAHVTGLEVGSFFKFHQIWSVTQLVARFRRVTGSMESPNGLGPVARSSPRTPVSVPPPSLDNTHVKLFDRWFSQIIPLGMYHTLLLVTNVAPLLQDPRFSHTLGALGPKTHTVCVLFLSEDETDLGVSFND